MSRFQVHFGKFKGEKGYVIIDTDEEPLPHKRNRKHVFTSDSKSDTEDEAQRRNGAMK